MIEIIRQVFTIVFAVSGTVVLLSFVFLGPITVYRKLCDNSIGVDGLDDLKGDYYTTREKLEFIAAVIFWECVYLLILSFTVASVLSAFIKE